MSSTRPATPAEWLPAVLERYGARPRLPATVYDTAQTPAAIRALLFRRAGVPVTGPGNPETIARGLALSRSPGWTPESLKDTLARGGGLPFRLLPVHWERALAKNPFLEMSWVHAALTARQLRAERGGTLVRDLVGRISGPTPPMGWSGSESVWGPVTAAAEALDVDIPVEEVSEMIHTVLETAMRDQTATDADVAALLRVSASREEVGSYPLEHHDPMLPLQVALLQHPAAGDCTLSVFLKYVERRCVGWWVDLPAVRPDWMGRPSIQTGIARLVDRLQGYRYAPDDALARFACTYGPPKQVARWWASRFPSESEECWSMLGVLPDATLDALGLTTQDLSQALVHAETAAARLGVLAALRRVGSPSAPAPHAGEAPTVGTLSAPYTCCTPPVIPEAFAAHHPVVRDWLATCAPGAPEYLEAVRRKRAADAEEERREDDSRRMLFR